MKGMAGFVLGKRVLVLSGAALVVAGGLLSWLRIPIDAFPDVTNVQVMILTESEGMAPLEMERLITYPIETGMNGLPRVKLVRSLSRTGLSQVVIVFEDDTDIYFARQQVLERLAFAGDDLPEGVAPELGPISTGLGEIFQYTIGSEGGRHDLKDLRTIQDWVIRPRLQAVPGVTEVNSFGGYLKQYQVVVDPDLLAKYGLGPAEVTAAIENNNSVASGNYVVRGGEQLVVRSDGLLRKVEELEDVVVAVRESRPVRVRDVAEVRIGHHVRQGAVTRDGKGETVCGMVIMLKGANSSDVVSRVKRKIAEIQAGLPPGVTISPFYDRAQLVGECVGTVVRALVQGGVLVVLVLFLVLRNLRLSAVVCASLPVTMLAAFALMKTAGITANLMTLGGLAVALGMVVDANIVVGENMLRRVSAPGGGTVERHALGAGEVMRPVLFAALIVMMVFVPLYGLQAVEGKMFKPLATSMLFAMAGSLLTAMTLTPVLASYLLKPQAGRSEGFVLERLKRVYLAVLDGALRRRAVTAISAAALFVLSLALLPLIGTEFLPYLDEGSIAINVVKFPTASLDESKKIGEVMERILGEFPEVRAVVTKTGRAEIAEDPMGPEQNDLIVMLEPAETWRYGSKDELIEAMREALSVVPGLRLTFSQPIALRVNELISGVKSDVAIKVFGYDLDFLSGIAERIEHAVEGVRGATDVKLERVAGLLELDIDVDRAAIARHGINAAAVNETVEATVGMRVVGDFYEQDRRFKIAVGYPDRKRRDVAAIGNVLVPSPSGARIPLSQLARVSVKEGPAQISREGGYRRVTVECNVRARDLGGFVAEARERVASAVPVLPPGCFISWGGQFENQERAMRTLGVLVPVVVIVILLLLYSAFGALRPALLVILNLPFALVGGIFAVLVSGVTLSVSAVVGFIVLFGTAVSNGVVLVSFFSDLRKGGAGLVGAVRRSCELRLRPLLLTTLTTMFGLMPLLWATGPGAEIQRPLAIVVLGGLVSSWLLTLIVLPVLYVWMEERSARR